MKIAVCYSGQCKGNFIKNNTSVKFHFPDADYFYSTWTEHVALMPPIEYVTYNEPKMHYHPLVNISKSLLPTEKLKANRNMASRDAEYYQRTLHHTKQILAHALQLNHQVPKSYDMIVRVRYDTYLSPKVSFKKYVDDAYHKKMAIGIGTRTSRHNNLDEIVEIPQVHPESFDDIQDWSRYLMDPMILHRRDMWSSDLVFKLHEQCQLLVAENGWYQILGEPFNDNHLCLYGGAQIEKYI